MDQVAHKVLRFDRFVLDLTRGCLRAGAQEIDLRPKAFELLTYLAVNAGRLVPKQELLDAVWPNVVVADESLTQGIWQLRQKLGDEEHRLIKTVSRRGYLLDARIEAGDVATSEQSAVHRAEPETKPGSSPVALAPSEVTDFSIDEVESGYHARPSIAVLPFRKLATGDDTYFADGIVDNIIHALAGLKELFVIARGSTLAFGGGPIDVQAIGSALGVRYLLYGSAQRADCRVRIATELIDTETSEVIRTANYDGELGDLFGLQDRIAEEVVKTIAPQVRQHELRRALRKHPQSMTAYDLVLQAIDFLYRMDHASFSRALGCLQRAMLIDPGYAPGFSYAAAWHMLRIAQEWSPSLATDTTEAARLSEAAIVRDERDPIALAIYGHVQSHLRKRFDEAFLFFDRANACSPNCPLPWTFRGATLCFVGDGPGAVANASEAVRLSPLDSHVFLAEHILAQAHYTNGDYHEAVRWARRSDGHNGRLTSNLRTLIASLVAVENTVDAREVVERHQRILPTFRVLEWAARTPMQGEVLAARVERLLAAGLPK
jgi:TolB-like protein/DNA-binding winged helix-turn-helix (wHTH) protein